MENNNIKEEKELVKAIEKYGNSLEETTRALKEISKILKNKEN